MKRIFKYTFLQRLPNIILHCAIMACMSGVELVLLLLTHDVSNGFYHLWFSFTVIALAVIPLSVFIPFILCPVQQRVCTLSAVYR
mgnify:CR=1 FL=1